MVLEMRYACGSDGNREHGMWRELEKKQEMDIRRHAKTL